ncbi:MAG: DUF2797 domain-containing protein [bacterium]|nr:DUF2797 domain-containing protein [bacterium]
MHGKNLILANVGFRKTRANWQIADLDLGETTDFSPIFGEPITLKINLRQKFCTGWHSLETGENFICPDNAIIDKTYNQCPKCQKRTGFNPAFYNMAENEISEQQIVRNSQPHFVYLAYFPDEIVKVGISFVGRGIARLLEQGARAALILGEFNTANIARNYEEKIANIPDFCENVKMSVKLKTLERKFSFSKAQSQLFEAREIIEKALNVKFESGEVLDLSEFYAKNGEIPNGEMINVENCAQSGEELIFSGVLEAQVGGILIAKQQGENIVLPLKKFVGYKIEISNQPTEIILPERQASLFDF